MSKPKVLIIEARFYEDIADNLRKGVVAELEKAGVDHDVLVVPGVFEIPATMAYAINAMENGTTDRKYGGFVTIGCVIRGETDHYDHICREASRALMDMGLEYPHGFGVLTCENKEQAEVRADPARKNKGRDAAVACLRMMEIEKHFGLEGR